MVCQPLAWFFLGNCNACGQCMQLITVGPTAMAGMRNWGNWGTVQGVLRYVICIVLGQ